ncbi:PKD domain-containing protein, partial [Microbacterium sp. STN6]|uniref:alkaline phosphatase family protein n=1 Tax=Microbacterium sp. STN6 TaxID=2995588 RepID=UPI00226083ED
TGKTATHTYSAAGTYTVTLTVTDNKGAVSTAVTKPVTVTAPAVGTVPTPDHVVVVVMENHSSENILGNANAPYINSLAASGASMTQSFAETHPSQPNYLALFSGSTQGLTTDNCPLNYTSTNIADQLSAAGLTFTGYAEDLPSVGFTGCQSGNYARKHSPWTNWASIPAAANQPFTAFPTDYSTLPTLSFVIPNLQHDMHDGTIAQGDAWLEANLAAYATWAQQHNSVLILTWDEDDNNDNNQIPTIIVGQKVKPGQYSERINHYNVLRTLQDAYGLTPNDGSAAATPLTDIWSQ